MKDFIEFIKSNPVFLISVTVVLILIVILILLILALSAQVKLEKISKERATAHKSNNEEMKANSKEVLDDLLNNESINTVLNLETTQLQAELEILQEENTPSGTFTEVLNESAASEQKTVVEVPLLNKLDDPSSNLVENEINKEEKTDILVSGQDNNTNIIQII
jgi:Na+-transporting methylmalonyl-CoA/oxaloacetate decarboxylase gamma subunit